MSSADHPHPRPHILLWSTNGSGLHYGGPGMTAFRLYSGGRATHPDFRISLAHGRSNHERYDLFESQHLISPVGMGKWSQIQFIRRARSWLAENARNDDVLQREPA